MKSHGAEWWRGSDTAPSKRFWICYKVAECYFNVWADWFSHIQLLQVTPGTTSEAVHETVTIVSLEKLEIAFLSLFITVKQFSFCVLEHILTVKTGELCKSGVLCQQRQQQHCPQEMKCLKATILHSVTFVSGVGLSECWQRYRNAGIMLLVLLVLLFLPLASRVGLVVILIGFFPRKWCNTGQSLVWLWSSKDWCYAWPHRILQSKATSKALHHARETSSLEKDFSPRMDRHVVDVVWIE